jgi:uncharacterized protein YrrD
MISRRGPATLRCADVIGLPAVLASGRSAGRVVDVVFTAQGDRVAFLLLRGGPGGAPAAVPYADVAGLGPAAVRLRRAPGTHPGPGPKAGRAHAAALGSRVLDASGRDLGVVADVCFRPDGGVVAGYALSQGLVGDVTEGQAFLSLEALGGGGCVLGPPG